MIRPTSLLRTDSTNTPEFSAPARNIKEGTIDCGITVLPCCLPSYFHRFATARSFLVAFMFLGICQGSTQAYFASTVRHIGELFHYSPAVVDWLLVSHDLFMGLFGLAVAYWGCRLQRAAWLGGLACFQGVACLMVMGPYLEHRGNNSTTVITPTGPNLCKDEVVPWRSSNLEIFSGDQNDNCWVTLVILFILQLFIGLGNASFYAHGFSYIDDNVDNKNSPVYLSIAIAIKMSSFQFGSLMAWWFLQNDHSWWIGYPILGALLLVSGTIIATFPSNLLTTVVKQTAALILDIARTNNSTQSLDGVNVKKTETTFIASFRRVLTNKIVLVNTLSSILLYMAVDNFSDFEGKYMESQYYIPIVSEGFNDPWTSRLLRNFLKPPIVALSVLVSGLIVAKFKPRTRKLAFWNVIIALHVAGVCFSYVFIDCKKENMVGEYKGHLDSPFCSRQCKCPSTKFEPVCTQNGTKTFFSPCHAGCKDVTYINDIKVFSECSCGVPQMRIKLPSLATEGACDNAQCALHWKLFQAFTVLNAGMIATGFIGNLLITLRAVHPLDKGMAIAFELCTAGILVHVPGKFIYKAISNATCQYPSSDGYNCSLHDVRFGDYISILTAALLLASAFVDGAVVYLVKDLAIFFDTDEDDEEPSASREMLPRVQQARSVQEQRPPSSENATLELIRPARPRTISSVRSMSPEDVPLTRDLLQRNVVEELRQYRSTQI